MRSSVSEDWRTGANFIGQPGSMDKQPTSWAFDRPVTSPFALPSGLRGYLAGRFMQRTNRQEDLLEVLDLHTGHRVLEVGYGPGQLIRILARRTDAGLIQGVDPSPVMRDLAIRNNRATVRTGRVRLGLGSAQDTGLPSQSMDRVVTVNNVAIWPDLDAGVRNFTACCGPAASPSSPGTAADPLLAWSGNCASPATGWPTSKPP